MKTARKGAQVGSGLSTQVGDNSTAHAGQTQHAKSKSDKAELGSLGSAMTTRKRNAFVKEIVGATTEAAALAILRALLDRSDKRYYRSGPPPRMSEEDVAEMRGDS